MANKICFIGYIIEFSYTEPINYCYAARNSASRTLNNPQDKLFNIFNQRKLFDFKFFLRYELAMRMYAQSSSW